ncbi:MAG TPA: serine hydrolase domain-containing protein [Anaerolineales bacterium]|nr:serine hydrolase domain-containing protein [Anaerolineales bacterium]
MRRSRFTAFLSLAIIFDLFISGCAQAKPVQTPTPTVPPATATLLAEIGEIDALLGNLADQSHFTGSVLIAKQGKVLLSQGYGLADREQNIPNTSQTRFRLGSVTKQFTAMAILILEKQGKLNVKDPICKYVPDCPSTWESITIKNLLTHTSGIPDFTGFADYLSSRAAPTTPLQTIARFKDKPLDFQPGEKFSYSNSGYIVLGYIIEQVSGQTYEDFLNQSIFTPLSLRDTGYDHNSNNLAVGYPDRYSTRPADFIDMSIPYAAGGLYSTVEDLYRWEQSLSTEKLVPKVYLDEMFAPQVAIPDSEFAYGYGWVIEKNSLGQLVDWHNGGIEGFATIIARYPDDQVTIIVLSNQQDTDPNLILQLLSAKIFGNP